LRKEKSLVDRIYEFFCSIKLSIFVLVALAVTSIFGTVLQQGAEYTEYAAEYGEFWARVIHTLSLDDMYHSWWFTLLLALLLVNITFCSIRRMPGAIRQMKDRDPLYEGKPTAIHEKWEKSLKRADEGETAEAVAGLLGKRLGKVERAEEGGAVFLMATRGGWARMGVYVTHFSLFLFAVGAIVGLQFGFKGFVGIVEGRQTDHVSYMSVRSHAEVENFSPATADREQIMKMAEKLASRLVSFATAEEIEPGSVRVRLMASGNDIAPMAERGGEMHTHDLDDKTVGDFVKKQVEAGWDGSTPVAQMVLIAEDFSKRLDFSVRCDSFELEFYDDGRPKEYASELTVFEDGKEVVSKQRIEVNSPLIHRGIYFYQSSYGEVGAGDLTVTVAGPDRQILVSQKKVPQGQMLQLPSGDALVARDIQRGQGRGMPTAVVFALLRDNRLITGGNVYQAMPMRNSWFPVGPYLVRLDNVDWIYYTGLQVARDPGVPIVWAGCILITFGLIVSFFISHRRVWAKVWKEGESVHVKLVGNASRNRVAFERWFEETTEEVQQLFEK